MKEYIGSFKISINMNQLAKELFANMDTLDPTNENYEQDKAHNEKVTEVIMNKFQHDHVACAKLFKSLMPHIVNESATELSQDKNSAQYFITKIPVKFLAERDYKIDMDWEHQLKHGVCYADKQHASLTVIANGEICNINNIPTDKLFIGANVTKKEFVEYKARIKRYYSVHF